ncbi:hypothetical protein [Cyclobacterium lianum]|nr:hypothetical protein [Cyclobacterium lianum]
MKIPALFLFWIMLLRPIISPAQDAGTARPADFKQAFEALPSSPETITLKNSITFDQEGGHLQGIQLYEKNTLYLSGSSAGYSYMATAKLDERTIIAIDTLLPSPLRHAGGFQVYDHYLAVGIEDNHKRDLSRIMVYDLKNEAPWQSPLARVERKGAPEQVTAGAVGLTAHQDKMWLLVANWDSKVLDMYTCPRQQFYGGQAEFRLHISFEMGQQDRENWIDPHWLSYQNLNLFTDARGQLYVAGTAQAPDGKQVAELFHLNPDAAHPAIVKISRKVFETSETVNFKAAAGLQVTHDGRLLLLGAPYQIRDETTIEMFIQKK